MKPFRTKADMSSLSRGTNCWHKTRMSMIVKTQNYCENTAYGCHIVSSMMLICCFSTSGSAQILPEADVECEDSVMLDISPDSVKQAIVNANCEPTGSESIEISYQSGNLNVAGPGSMTVEGEVQISKSL